MAIEEKMALLHAYGEDGTHYLVYPVTSIEAVVDLPEKLQEIQSGTAGKNYTVTIGTSWEDAGNLLYQAIPCPESLSTDRPRADLLLPLDAEASAEQMENWERIHSIHTMDGYVAVYAMDPTDVELTIQLGC